MIRKKFRTSPKPLPDHGLELLLAYDGRVEYLPGGYVLRFTIRSEATSVARPHGLRYSFTLHDPGNRRILGFDNAHSVRALGRNRRRTEAHDHWHRDVSDTGRPYVFTDAATLLRDFYNEAERLLLRRGVVLDVVGDDLNEET